MKKKTNALQYTAFYCRLSRDDRTESESNSTSIQKMILGKYAKEHGYPVTKFYVDDGFSGANFERPGFQEMLTDIKEGKIDPRKGIYDYGRRNEETADGSRRQAHAAPDRKTAGG